MVYWHKQLPDRSSNCFQQELEHSNYAKMESCNWMLKFCYYVLERDSFLSFLPCYIVGNCAGRSWFLINSKWNAGPIQFKLVLKVCYIFMNDWNKVSQNVTEEFSWKLQWPVYKNNTVYANEMRYSILVFIIVWISKEIHSGSKNFYNFRHKLYLYALPNS